MEEEKKTRRPVVPRKKEPSRSQETEEAGTTSDPGEEPFQFEFDFNFEGFDDTSEQD